MFIVIVARLATARLRGLATETWRSILGLGDFPDPRILCSIMIYIRRENEPRFGGDNKFGN